MNADLHYLAYAVVLTWVMLMTASLVRVRGWTPKGLWLAMGNRDDLPEPTPLAARADRAAKNMLEGLLLFAVVVVVARLGGVPSEKIEPGAALFFWSRVLFFPIYLAGIKLLRTVVWTASIVGLVMILVASH
jgi:uncharacterized MAPEG superfamily protein